MDLSNISVDVLLGLVGASVGYGVVKNKVDSLNSGLERLEDTVNDMAKTVGNLRVDIARLQGKERT